MNRPRLIRAVRSIYSWRQPFPFAFIGEPKQPPWCYSARFSLRDISVIRPIAPDQNLSQKHCNCLLVVVRSCSSQSLKGSANCQGVSSEILDAKMSHYVVGHDPQKKFFYIQLRNGNTGQCGQQGDLAILEYHLVRPGLVDLYHTEVPPEFQGQGIAKHLAKAAFDYCCENDLKFKPTCTYLQKYLKENPNARYTYYKYDVNVPQDVSD